jgi:hypothetical protein
MADQYPQGKLTESDEGELDFSIAVHEGRVILNWGKPVQWIGVAPSQARAIAASLLRRADEAEQQPRTMKM